MISYIRGELVAVEEDKVIVDVNGMGFGIYMPAQSMNCLPPVGEEVKLHTYMNVREDAMQLFGFLTRDDLKVFKLVILLSPFLFLSNALDSSLRSRMTRRVDVLSLLSRMTRRVGKLYIILLSKSKNRATTW